MSLSAIRNTLMVNSTKNRKLIYYELLAGLALAQTLGST